MAKGIDFCGGYLFVPNVPEGASQRLVRLQKLTEHAQHLARLVLTLPREMGEYYGRAVREAAISTLLALARLPEAHQQMRLTRQAPAPFVWNQTLRLRDIPENALTHLMIRWERWSCQLREACEELRLLRRRNSLLGVEYRPPSSPDAAAASEEGGAVSYEADRCLMATPSEHSVEMAMGSSLSQNHLPFLAPAETLMVRECSALVRLVRSLFKRIRSRILLHVDSIALVDELYTRAERTAQLAELLVSHMSPPHASSSILSISFKLTQEAQDLAQLAADRALETHADWFNRCYERLEALLYPIIERNPTR